MNLRCGSVPVFLTLLTAVDVYAEITPSKALLVLSKTERTLAIVDPSTLKVLARVPVGPDPHEVIASSDGKLAFVSNYGGGAYNTLAVIDLVEQKALPSVDLGALRGPHGLMFVGGKVWFTAETAKAIGSYDPVTKKVDLMLGTGQNGTHMIFVTDDLKRIVTSNIGSGTMTFIDKTSGPGQGGWEETVVPVGRRAEGFDIAPGGRELWAANAQDGTISIIDMATRKVTETLSANVDGANRLKFTPDGKLVFVSTLRGAELSIFDATTHALKKRVNIGHGAAGIQMQPDGERVFVACTPDGYVAIVNLKSLDVSGHLDAGKQPDGMAWAVRQ